MIIGNSAYADIPLANPVNDARLMSQTLRDLGFDVIEVLDADQNTMKYAIVEFGEKLDLAGKAAVGLFYYAGHGLQVGGENFLVPIGARIKKESAIRDSYVFVIESLERQEVGSWTSGVSRCGFRRRAG